MSALVVMLLPIMVLAKFIYNSSELVYEISKQRKPSWIYVVFDVIHDIPTAYTHTS